MVHIRQKRTQARHSGASHSGEPGSHFSEAGVHRFRAPPFGAAPEWPSRLPRHGWGIDR